MFCTPRTTTCKKKVFLLTLLKCGPSKKRDDLAGAFWAATKVSCGVTQDPDHLLALRTLLIAKAQDWLEYFDSLWQSRQRSFGHQIPNCGRVAIENDTQATRALLMTLNGKRK